MTNYQPMSLKKMMQTLIAQTNFDIMVFLFQISFLLSCKQLNIAENRVEKFKIF